MPYLLHLSALSCLPAPPAPSSKKELPLPSVYWEPSVSLELVDGPEGAPRVEAWTAGQPAGLELLVVFEMYSSWCPRCKKFRPHYDKIARVFNPGGSGEKAGVLVAHMSCDKDKVPCKRLGTMGFPALLWTTLKKVRSSIPPSPHLSHPRPPRPPPCAVGSDLEGGHETRAWGPEGRACPAGSPPGP